jgi:hypothetical protein
METTKYGVDQVWSQPNVELTKYKVGQMVFDQELGKFSNLYYLNRIL